MWLPLFLCRIFHRKHWLPTSGTMDAWDYDCPKCHVTICLKCGGYPANRFRYKKEGKDANNNNKRLMEVKR